MSKRQFKHSSKSFWHLYFLFLNLFKIFFFQLYRNGLICTTNHFWMLQVVFASKLPQMVVCLWKFTSNGLKIALVSFLMVKEFLVLEIRLGIVSPRVILPDFGTERLHFVLLRVSFVHIFTLSKLELSHSTPGFKSK